MQKTIILKAGRTQTAVVRDECDVFETHDSIKEAKQRLSFVPNGEGNRERYLFSRGYQNVIEAGEPLRYAQILVDGVCLYDYFAKGPENINCPPPQRYEKRHRSLSKLFRAKVLCVGGTPDNRPDSSSQLRGRRIAEPLQG